MKHTLMIIDDEVSICSALTFAFEDKYEVHSASAPQQALALLKSKPVDVCLLDIKIGKHDGLKLLPEIKNISPSTIVIMVTAYGSIESSVDAMKNGAYTYLCKPLSIDELSIVLDQAIEYKELHERVQYLSQELADKMYYHGMIGKSPAMRRVYDMIERLKEVDSSVLVMGESGTGKELVARALHFAGPRSKEHFAVVNCAAIPEGLLESELFGYKKGAFTGAVADMQGKLAYANEGTLFLDEIGDMPLALQAKILRVLQAKEYSPIGSNEKYALNIRLVSATNRNLPDMVAKGLFRKDLYFRLNVVEITLPPLKDRQEDIRPLIKHILEQNNQSLRRNVTGIEPEAQRLLYNYTYPGNVRELINIMEYAMVMCDGDTLLVEHLPPKLKGESGASPCEESAQLDTLVGLSLEEVEKRVIEGTLLLTKGHRVQTAKILGISEKGLRNKLAKFGLSHIK